jgi:hypothetical protein
MFRFLLLILSIRLIAEEIPLDYQLMDQEMFEDIIVGNTVIGITRQSHSVYLLYFLAQGDCTLWKQNQIYTGKWWIETDDLGRDCVRALWPDYVSSQPRSLFSPQNPRYGTATSLHYYIHRTTGALLLCTKKVQVPVLLAPGCVFPPTQANAQRPCPNGRYQ